MGKVTNLGKVGLTLAGDWNDSHTYEVLTVVLRKGKSYVSLVDNVNVDPLADKNTWQLLVEADDAWKMLVDAGLYKGTREQFLQDMKEVTRCKLAADAATDSAQNASNAAGLAYKAAEDANEATNAANKAASNIIDVNRKIDEFRASGNIAESSILQIAQNSADIKKSTINLLISNSEDIELPDNIKLYISNDNIWESTYRCILIPVIPNETYIVKANSSSRARYTYIKSYPVGGESVQYAEGYSSVVDIESNEYAKTVAPSDSMYLYVYFGGQSGTMAPEYVKHYVGVDELIELIKKVGGDSNKSYEDLNILISNNERSIAKNHGGVVSIPYKSGYYDTTSIESGITIDNVELLKKNSNETICWCIDLDEYVKKINFNVYGNTGARRRWFYLDSDNKVINVSGDSSLYTGKNVVPTGAKKVLVNNLTSKLSANDAYVKLEYDNALEGNRKVNSVDTTGKGYRLSASENKVVASNSASYYVDTFKIDYLSATYEATGRVGISDSPLVMYLDADKNVISHEFSNEDIEYPSTITRKLTIPSNAAYVLVQSGGNVKASLSIKMPISEFVNSIADNVESSYFSNHNLGKGVKILTIGNSWARDSIRWLYAIGHECGIDDIVVGQAYLGGSSIQDQYYGMDDVDYSYSHDGKLQKVHSTYQYWKYYNDYSNKENNYAAKKTPSSGYNNGMSGIGVTLQSVLKDEDWDYIIFLPSIQNCSLEHFNTLDQSSKKMDIRDFVAKIKSELQEESLKKVKFGLASPWTYADNGTNTVTQLFLDTFNGGNSITGWTKEQRNELFNKAFVQSNNSIIEIADWMGDDCSFIINSSYAIQNGRKNPILKKLGFNLQRATSNTHLSEGIPMYIVALCYAYELLGVDRRMVKFFPKVTSGSVDGDTGDSIAVITPTSSIAEQAKKCSWVSQMCTL